MLNSIGPIWDGNEVWLVDLRRRHVRRVPGGVRDGLLGLLPRLHARALRPDLPRRLDRVPQQDALDRPGGGPSTSASSAPACWRRSSSASPSAPRWRASRWTTAGSYVGGFLDLLSPYSLLVGLLAVATCSPCTGRSTCCSRPRGPSASGSTAGPGPASASSWSPTCWSTIMTLATIPRATANFRRYPLGLAGGRWPTSWRSPTSRGTSSATGRPGLRLQLRDDRRVRLPVRDRPVPEPRHQLDRPEHAA